MPVGLGMKKGILTALLIFPLVVYGRAGSTQKISPDYVAKRETGQEKTTFRIHSVKKGETIYSISRKYGIAPLKISEINNLDANSSIKAGMRLRIPASKICLSESDPVPESKKDIAAEKKSATAPVLKPSSNFSWPVRKIVSVTKESDISKGIGIFIKSNPGSKVFCAGDGKVMKIGYMRGYGNYVVISHGGRFLSIYSMITPGEVKPGRCVRRGEVIGTINRDSGGVHFQISKSGKPLDPEKILPQRS